MRVVNEKKNLMRLKLSLTTLAMLFGLFGVLMLAAFGGRAEIVKALIDAGANIDAKDSKGKSVMEYADRDQGILAVLQKGGG